MAIHAIPGPSVPADRYDASRCGMCGRSAPTTLLGRWAAALRIRRGRVDACFAGTRYDKESCY